VATFEWMPLSCDLQPLGCTSTSEELNITLQLEMLLEMQSAVCKVNYFSVVNDDHHPLQPPFAVCTDF
jgi:hypothetical protein